MASEVDGELSETAQFYRSFWVELLDELRLDDASQPMANVTQSENLYFKIPPSISSAWVSSYFSKSKNNVGVYMRLSKRAMGDEAYRSLLEDRESIEADLGFKAEWKEFDKSFSISVARHFPDVHDPKYRADIKQYLSHNINQFVNVFRPRMARFSEEG